MSVHLGDYNGDAYVWGLSHNDSHRAYKGYTDYINISIFTTTQPLRVSSSSAFGVYIESSATIDSQASGNNCYPPSTALSYYNMQTIYESADRDFTWGSTNFPSTDAIAASTYFLECYGAENVSSTSKGFGIYGASTEAPVYYIDRGGWYNSNGRVLAQFESDTSGLVSNLQLYAISYQSTGFYFPSTMQNLTIRTEKNGNTVIGDRLLELTASTGIDLNSTDGISTIIVNSSGVQVPINIADGLGNPTSFINRDLFVKKVSQAGEAVIYGKIEDSTYIRLINQYDWVQLKAISTSWIIKDKNRNVYSGYNRRSDYENVHTGTPNIIYDGASGAPVVGEKIQCTSTSSTTVVALGYVINDPSTTTIVLRDIVSTGSTTLFPDNFEIEGEVSGFTALVNGDVKNADCDFYHGFNKNIRELEIDYYISTDGTESGSFRIYSNAGNASLNVGQVIYQVGSSSFQLQWGSNGESYVDGDGARTLLDTDDYWINVRVRDR